MENDEKVKVPLVTVEEPVEDTVEVEDPIDEDNKDANMESEKKKKKKKRSKKKPVTGRRKNQLLE